MLKVLTHNPAKAYVAAWQLCPESCHISQTCTLGAAEANLFAHHGYASEVSLQPACCYQPYANPSSQLTPHSSAPSSLNGLDLEVCANQAEDHAFEILHSQHPLLNTQVRSSPSDQTNCISAGSLMASSYFCSRPVCCKDLG